MLSELHVEHLGVIERLDLVFGPGLTAVTGETGAGKTMLVEALELLVGGRADASIVRPGAPEVRIDGRFVELVGHGGTDELVLSRVVPAEGRSRAYVDGRPSTVAALAEVAAPIVDLHGQHAHQSLLAPATQRAALDQFGGVDLAPLRAARARLTELDAELAALGGDLRSRAREIDLLRFQVDELVAAGLDDPDEERRLEALEDQLADAVGHRTAGAAAHAALTEDGGGRDALAAAVGALAGRSPYGAVEDRVRSLLAELDDLVSDLGRIRDGIEEDPQQLADRHAPGASSCATSAASTATPWSTCRPIATKPPGGWPSWRASTSGRPTSRRCGPLPSTRSGRPPSRSVGPAGRPPRPWLRP